MVPTGEDSKSAIIEAAWRVVDRRGVAQILAGVSLRDIGDEIGMSASTISYHFESQEGLAWAMIDSLVHERDGAPLRELTEALRQEPAEDPAIDPGGKDASELVRVAAQSNWESLVRPESMIFERRLMRVFAATGSDSDGATITARLRDGVWQGYLEPLTELIETVNAAQRRHFVEPFTATEVTRIVTATAERLLHQQMLDPGAVRPDLLADAMVAFFSAVLRPDHAKLGIDELESSMRVLERPDGTDPEVLEWRRRVAGDAAVVFDRPANQVSLTDVARAAGVPVREVAEMFRGSTEVAAVSAYRYLPDLRSAVERRLDQDVELALVDYLCELTRLARLEPTVWGALSLERQRAVFEPGPDVHIDVPVDLALQAGFGAMGLAVAEAELEDLSRLVIDTVLSYSLTRPAVAPHAVANLALRLVPIGD